MAFLTVGPNSKFKSIADAMSFANPNDTIVLESGYSNESSTIIHNGMTVNGTASSIGIVLKLDAGITGLTLTGTAPINVVDSIGGNTVVGNDGNNLITVTSGIDAVDGGLGTDRLVVDYHLANGAVTGDSTSNFTEAGGGGRMVTVTNGSFEHFTVLTGSESDTITTGAGDDIINVGEGANTVTAGQGTNWITGGSGADTFTALDGGNFLNGGDGTNHLTSGSENDTILSGIGADTIVSGAGDDLITITGGADTVMAGTGLDRLTVDYSKMVTGVTGGVTGGDLSSGYTGHIADLVGSTADFQNVENFRIITGSGNDLITTGAGTDTVIGGAGNDCLDGGTGTNTLDGGAGDDTVVLGFKLTDASISYDAAGHTVLDGPSGAHNVLSGFEHFQFTDGTVNENTGSALVDDLFYYVTNKDVWSAGLDAEAHYSASGWQEGRNPNAAFSTTGYLAANPDVAKAGLNPLTHYDQYGWKEGRDPSAAFDNELYLSHNPDVKAAGIDPLAHYLSNGQAEGRQANAAIGKAADLATHPGFDAEYYLLSNTDVAKAALSAGGDTFAFAYQHYEASGWHEGRNPNAVFDTKGYLAAYADVKAANIDPLAHYDTNGWHEGRDPSVNFDTKAYLGAYADVKAAGLDPMEHYLQYGALDGRNTFADGHFG